VAKEPANRPRRMTGHAKPPTAIDDADVAADISVIRWASRISVAHPTNPGRAVPAGVHHSTRAAMHHSVTTIRCRRPAARAGVRGRA
jgi:hypothetical protein